MFDSSKVTIREGFQKKTRRIREHAHTQGGGEGGVREPALTPPYVFFIAYSKPTCLILGSPK